MSVKGSWSRVQEHDQYRENWDRIFARNKKKKPSSDAKQPKKKREQ